MSPPAQLLRPLGDVESLYWTLDRICRTNFVVAAELEGPLCRERWSRGLEELVRLHPRLGARIVLDEERGPCLDPNQLRTPTLEVEDWNGGLPELGDAAQREQGRPFSEQGPLARARLLLGPGGRSQLLLTLHHSVADARSGLYLAQRLHQLAAAERPLRLPGRPPEEALGPPLSELLPREARGRRGLLGALGEALGNGLAAAGGGRISGLPLDQPCPPWARVDRFLPLPPFEAAISDRLVRACRGQGTSVHGALAAAQLQAIAEDGGVDTPRRLGLNSLVDLRSRLNPRVPVEALGPMVSFLAGLHRLASPWGFWSLARKVTRQLRAQLRRGAAFLQLPVLARVVRARRLHLRAPEEAGRFFDRLERWLPPVSLLSNAGRVPELSAPAPSLSPRLTGLHFFLALSSSGPFGAAAASFRGRLRLNLSYASPNIEDARALRLGDRMRELLLEAAT